MWAFGMWWWVVSVWTIIFIEVISSNKMVTLLGIVRCWDHEFWSFIKWFDSFEFVVHLIIVDISPKLYSMLVFVLLLSNNTPLLINNSLSLF